MPTTFPKPQQFASIQEYLVALKFVTNGDYFVCGTTRFPTVEICGHTCGSFAEKMKAHGWMPTEGEWESVIRWPV